MTCVVLGGSRRISRLDGEIRLRLDRIVQQQFRLIVGDANGADKALQNYLVERAYRNVEVFCSGSSPRNNLGGWVTRPIAAKARPGTFEFFAAKDQAMAELATVGFMLWDGESTGTMLNVWRLAKQRKSCLVYVHPRRQFLQVVAESDWHALWGMADAESRAVLERRIKNESGAGTSGNRQLFGPDLDEVGLS